jgi:hypothetical protein
MECLLFLPWKDLGEAQRGSAFALCPHHSSFFDYGTHSFAHSLDAMTVNIDILDSLFL